MAEKIEKKISRVMRWLERCASACRGESYGNALMDIECARVDFDSARDEIWNTVNKRYNNKASVRGYFVRLFRTIATAAVILLSAAAPLSYVENTYSAMTTNSLEWVNSDEKALLKNLREQLSNANSGWVSDITDLPAETYLEAPKTEIKRTSNTYAGKEQISASRNDVQKVNTDMKNEAQIFTLLKIGENALKGKPSAVTVER
ncbi:MAG: hypothetical protein FWE49_01635 [Synergistaceae bacterium]|nr:hypothetical protein [Synergistaceae bacterium]